jgi:hypothetical protein
MSCSDSQRAPFSSASVSAFMPSFEAAPASIPAERLAPPSMPPSRLAPQSIPPSRLAPPQGGLASIPPAAPSARRAQGGIYNVVRQLDKKHGSFFISRLILMTGINLRNYDAATHDDPHVVEKLVKALRSLVKPADLDGLLQLLPGQR